VDVDVDVDVIDSIGEENEATRETSVGCGSGAGAGVNAIGFSCEENEVATPADSVPILSGAVDWATVARYSSYSRSVISANSFKTKGCLVCW